MIETWDMRRGELVGRSATIRDAIRAGRNDMGRTITIVDALGRIAAMMRDGRVLS